MRAIDADAFKEYIRGACEDMKHLFKDNADFAKLITESFCKDIDEQPTIQPEIVRCKDCKNWDTTWTNDFSPNYHYCPMVDGVRKEDWFCADAERRTDE